MTNAKLKKLRERRGSLREELEAIDKVLSEQACHKCNKKLPKNSFDYLYMKFCSAKCCTDANN